ncbi:MAG TPA: 2-hydroxyglutaryl-CoA dehydratase [candidate division Zixibacteria bacterium]|nr:2-hydroxyglutaryl-CoA dehydratase [candidate division Zixibacteria bacterium]
MKQILGIDLGSRSVKIAVRNGEDVAFRVFDTAKFFSELGKPSDAGFVLDREKLDIDDDCPVHATGYGRNSLNIANAEIVPEIQAHTLGAIEQTGIEDFTLIDLGGQDSKVVRVEAGRVAGFRMNDRCAASAGRYIENMAGVLGMSLEEISLHWENPEKLTSTCAVFGESEIVAKLAKGVDRARLASGVNLQIVNKISAELEAMPPRIIVLVGGVALNIAIPRLLAQKFKISVIIPEFPQFNAVIGLVSGK